jgi:hypothetical protein
MDGRVLFITAQLDGGPEIVSRFIPTMWDSWLPHGWWRVNIVADVEFAKSMNRLA